MSLKKFDRDCTNFFHDIIRFKKYMPIVSFMRHKYYSIFKIRVHGGQDLVRTKSRGTFSLIATELKVDGKHALSVFVLFFIFRVHRFDP